MIASLRPAATLTPPLVLTLQHMEKDKALERRFQQVYVKQPNVEDTVSPAYVTVLAYQ